MCGICGSIGNPDTALLRRMMDALSHRGPDADGLYLDDHAALGHRRLVVLDPAGGVQPMSDPEGRYHLVFNGEIYNHKAIRVTLEAKGEVFRSQSDTEVVLAAYRQYGAACVQHLHGMFAFAVWDRTAESLFLARDPLGIKPLYYTQCSDTLYFASEIKALLCAPAVPRRMDMHGLCDVLTLGYSMPPHTCFEGIRQLPPAHYARWEAGQLSTTRYWRPALAPAHHSEVAWAEGLDALLRDIVPEYRQADVPVGLFLSGGLDSAAIAHYTPRDAAAPMCAYTLGFGAEGRALDETAQAKAAADHFGVEQRVVQVHHDVVEDLDAVVRHFDEPFGNPTALLSYALSRAARKDMTVALAGDGGDEIFGGYPRYRGVQAAQRYRKLPGAIRKGLINPLIQRLPEHRDGNPAVRRLRAFSAGSLRDPVAMYLSWITYFDPALQPALFLPEVQRAIGGYDPLAALQEMAQAADTKDPAARAMLIDLQSFLPENVLRYGDRMSMAHGLELRVPFADRRIVDWMLTVPTVWKVHHGQTKRLLRRTMTDHLPLPVLQGKKQGLVPPMAAWLKGDLRGWAEDMLAPATLHRRGLFQADTVQTLLNEHQCGRRDHSLRLWALISVEAWLRAYMD